MSKVILFALGCLILLCIFLVAVLGRIQGGTCPVLVTVSSIEPANVFDDAGQGMWVVHLSISNSLWLPVALPGPIYISDPGDSGAAVEGKVLNRWTRLDVPFGKCALNPPNAHPVDVVVPTNTAACRINFKWTRARLTSGRMRWAAARFSKWLPSGISGRLWRLGWGGFPQYQHGSHWQKVSVELPLDFKHDPIKE